MAFCMKSELDLFSKPPKQASILFTEEVAYRSVVPIDSRLLSLEFVLPAQNLMRDLSSMCLHLKIRLLNADNKHHENDHITVCNNVLASLFKEANIFLNGKAVSQVDINYGYRAMFENLLTFGSDSSKTHMSTEGYFLDNGGVGQLDYHIDTELDFDALFTKEFKKIVEDATVKKSDVVEKNDVRTVTVVKELIDKIENDRNTGFRQRRSRFAKSVVVELLGRPHLDLLNQQRLIPTNVEIKVIFTFADPKFYIMEKQDGNSSLEILDATLFINHVHVSPEYQLSIERNLQKGVNAKYFYNRNEVKSYTITPGSKNFSIDNLVTGQLPNLIIFGMVSNAAYTGTRNLSPYRFQHFNMNKFNLTIDGRCFPNEPLSFDFSTDKPCCGRAYRNLFKDLNLLKNTSHTISEKMFVNNCFLLVFDLTDDASYGDSSCGNMFRTGSVRAVAAFDKTLDEAITCICYASFSASLEIDKYRNIITSS